MSPQPGTVPGAAVRPPPRPGSIAVPRPVPPARPGSITVSRPVAAREPGSIPVARPVRAAPTGSLAVRRVFPAAPVAGAIASPVVVRRRPAGSIPVSRVVRTLPTPGSRPVLATDALTGRGERGTVTVGDRVVEGVARRAAADHPDAGAVASRMLGVVPGAGRLGARSTSLQELPKTSVEVDGARAWVALELSVRYPAPVAVTTQEVRERIRDRVLALTGVEVAEVDITVRALVTDLPAAPRVR